MSKRECMNVKVDAEVVRRAKVVAAAQRVTLSDYISKLLRTLIEADLARVARGLLGSEPTANGPPEEDRWPRAAG
jgi:hypothetical protein